MQRILMLTLISTILALGAGVAQGKECKGVNFPDQAQLDGSNLTLNGLGLRQATMLKVSVYVAALYVAKVSTDPNTILGSGTPKALLSIWLGDPPNPEIKSGLLGGGAARCLI